MSNPPAYDSNFLAKLLLISQRRIQQLAKDGVIPGPQDGKYDLVKTIQGYVRFLQERVNGGALSKDLNNERVRLTAANADKTELEVEVLKGNLIPAEVVADTWSDIAANIKNKLLALPSKSAMQVAHLNDAKEIEGLLMESVREALDELVSDLTQEYVQLQSLN